MEFTSEQIIRDLSGFNPWWRDQPIADLPNWRRAAFHELNFWLVTPPTRRAIFLSGARQVGKTTIMLQAIHELLDQGVPRENILYVTFDHPTFKLAGIDKVIDAWRSRAPRQDGLEYIFLDEAQFIPDYGTWVKHQVDFNKKRQIIFTGSAMPLVKKGQESGVGRWHNIRLSTLSFYEYIRLKKLELPSLPSTVSLRALFNLAESDLKDIAELAKPYLAYFHNYLIYGGFPQTALVNTITMAQKLLREDIIDKAIKRDMTAIFGVRNIAELEHCFLYLCYNDGGILDISALSQQLNISRPTVQNFIDIFESSHLIYRLPPLGYGKQVLRGRYKIYLADASIGPAIKIKGAATLDDQQELGVAAESAVMKHLYTHYYQQNLQFSYWRNKKGQEVDLIAQIAEETIPFEVKYRSLPQDLNKLKGLLSFCAEKSVSRGYVVTKMLDDFGPLVHKGDRDIFCIPAALLCYWMGEIEHKKF